MGSVCVTVGPLKRGVDAEFCNAKSKALPLSKDVVDLGCLYFSESYRVPCSIIKMNPGTSVILTASQI